MTKVYSNPYAKLALLIALLVLSVYSSHWMRFTYYASAEEGVNIEVILDASGSMVEQIDGKSKILIAKDVILKLVKKIQAKASATRVGLRVYGQQSPTSAHNCKDSRLEIPLAQVDLPTFQRKLTAISPKGYTPIAYSLQGAIKDLPRNASNHVILITDGEETCGGDIKAAAQQLKKAGIVAHVVGYKITGKERGTIAPIYQLTGGQYFDVGSKEGLEVVLGELVAAATGKTGLASEDPDVLYRTALAQFGSGNYQGAKKLLEKAVGMNANDPKIHDLLGRTYQAMESTADAVKEFELAIKFAPDNSEYEARLKKAQEELKLREQYDAAVKLAVGGDYAGAIAEMQKLAKGSAWYAKGQQRIKEWQNMIAHAADQKDKDIYDQAVALAKDGKLQEAIDLVKTVPAGKWGTEAQKKIAEWSGLLTDKEAKAIFDKAVETAQGGDYVEAIKIMQGVGSRAKLYAEAAKRIAQWQSTLAEAKNKATYEEGLSQGDAKEYTQAIATMHRIPKQSSYYTKAQKKIEEWNRIVAIANIPDVVNILLGAETAMIPTFSPDGKYLASGINDNTVGLWDSTSGKLSKIFRVHGRVASLAFSRDGKWLACGGGDENTTVLDTRTRKEQVTLKGRSTAFSQDGQYLAAGSFNKIIILNAHTWQPYATLPVASAYPITIAFSPRGPWFAASSGADEGAGTNEIRIWNIHTRKRISTLTAYDSAPFAFSPDGKSIAYRGTTFLSNGRLQQVILRNLVTNTMIASFGHDDQNGSGSSSLAFSPDGHFLASATSALYGREYVTGTIKVWNVITKQIYAQFDGTSVTFSPDGKRLAFVSGPQTITIKKLTNLQ